MSLGVGTLGPIVVEACKTLDDLGMLAREVVCFAPIHRQIVKLPFLASFGDQFPVPVADRVIGSEFPEDGRAIRRRRRRALGAF